MSGTSHFLYRPGWLACRVFYKLFGGVRVVGRENLPPDGRFLICANHASLLDPPAVGLAFRSPIGYLAKKELFSIPLFGPLLRTVGAIPVDRSRLGKGTLDAIAYLLNTGIPVLVFPEGTRSRTGRLGRGKAGVGLLAREMAVPLVPTYVHGTRYWPRTWKKANRICVDFGLPIPAEWVAETAADKTGYQGIADRLMSEIQTLRDCHRAASALSPDPASTGDCFEHRLYARTGKSQ